MGLLEQWLTVFELLNRSSLDVETWILRWLLADNSATAITLQMSTYQAYQAGSLESLKFLVGIEVEHQPQRIESSA